MRKDINELIEDLITKFEKEIKEKLDLKLTDSNKKIIRERLAEHKNCIKHKFVDVYFYGAEEIINVALECDNCGEVIIDSDVIGISACRELQVLPNEDETEFKIGWNDEDFNSTSDTDIMDGLSQFSKEEDVTAFQQKFGGKTEYYDYRTGKAVTIEEYKEHFKNYNSDKHYILPTTTFVSKEQAENCKDQLKKFI